MSWTCPNQIKDIFCKLRKTECQAGAKGCVLEGKVQVIKKELEQGEDKATGKQSKKSRPT